jgi:hypothetical protein
MAEAASLEAVTLVVCDRRALRLLETSCTRLWLSCRDAPPAPWEGRALCVDCPAGAVRAGVELAPPTAAALLRHVCARCGQESDRIIGGLFCISCYNRHLEVLRGRNGKGTRPRLTDRLHSVRLAVSGAPVQLERVTGRVEAMVTLGKRHAAPGALAFGRPRLNLERADGQLELWV